MPILSKTFSRERPLFYIRIWNDSDRMAISRWLGVNVLTSLFLREGKTNKISVWYDLDEFGGIEKKIAKVILDRPGIIDEMIAVLQEQWLHIGPYLEEKKNIESIDDFEFFFRETVRWWSVMAIFFLIPEIATIPKHVKDQTLSYRLQVEKYSDRIGQILVTYFESAFPELRDLSFVIQPEEAITVAREGLANEELEDIRARLDGFVLLNGELYLKRDVDRVLTEKNLGLAEEKIAEDVSEIRGQSASNGQVRGKVRLILFKSQVGELEEGEVLVTEMTNPDFVQAMKKAAAIITDEGGIMCHAAIVARELGKPCIIGTKFATKILKDGDLVEVDAGNGIVTLIK